MFNTTPPDGASFPPLTFQEQYIEISTSLPPADQHALFGLGESTRSAGMKLQPGTTYTLFASDTPSSSAETNLYGSHPFYLDVHSSGQAHGVFLLNSNGMDVVYGQQALTYKVIGGVLDFYFFAGPSPLAGERHSHHSPHNDGTRVMDSSHPPFDVARERRERR